MVEVEGKTLHGRRAGRPNRRWGDSFTKFAGVGWTDTAKNDVWETLEEIYLEFLESREKK